MELLTEICERMKILQNEVFSGPKHPRQPAERGPPGKAWFPPTRLPMLVGGFIVVDWLHSLLRNHEVVGIH